MYRDYFFTRKKKNSNNTFLKLIPVILHAVYNIIKNKIWLTMHNHLNTLRNSIRIVRAKLSVEYKTQAQNKVIRQIQGLKQWRYAKKIALYHAFQGEIDLSELWRTAPLQGKYCAFPVLTEQQSLMFLPATPASSFSKNRFGIQEPDIPLERAIPPEQFDIIFMPLVAFDSACNRLGMGGGYYDRTFANSRGKYLIGLAYDFQRVPQLIPRAWDVSLDAIITPSEIFWHK